MHQTGDGLSRDDEHGLHSSVSNLAMIDAERSHRITQLRAAIEQFHPQPAFSCLFGSTARGDTGPLSDIDVGVSFAREVPLTVLARLSEDLEEAAGCSVDLVELSGLWERKPTLSYRIACEMQVLTVEDQGALVRFRTRSFLEYMDTEPLRWRMKDSLLRRLAAGRAGQRNYVG